MPTGYTAPIYDNEETTADKQAVLFALGLGFTIMQRDQDISVPPSRRRVPNHYEDRIFDLETKRDKIIQASDDDLLVEQERAINQAEADRDRAEQQDWALRKRYIHARDVFTRWRPQTEVGRAVKKFALQQINESIDFDTVRDIGRYYKVPTVLSAAEYRAKRLAEVDENLERARKSLSEEQERVRTQNKWIDDFYSDIKSLEGIRLDIK